MTGTAPAGAGLEIIEIETRSQPGHSVIWLHGLGADGNDMVSLMRELALPDVGIRFVFPHAPMMPVTVNGGYVMRAWYDILDSDLAPTREDAHGIAASQAKVAALLDREVSRGTPASRIVLAGFSQGGAITLQTGLRYRQTLAGLMVLSGYLPLMSLLEKERNPANQDTPVFIGHGTVDNVVPVSLAQATVARLTQAGYGVDWHPYPISHGVCEDELSDIENWLGKVMLPATS